MSPRFVRHAALFYAALVAVAMLWNGLRGRELLALGDSVGLDALIGVLTAAGTVALGVLFYLLVPVMRKIADELAPVLVDGTGRAALVLLSICSGVGEEALFRGAMQPELGLVATSLIFGLLHVGPDRRYLVWTAWAILAGFLFGLLYLTTGGIVAPAVAHVLHNAATFLLWKRSRTAKAA
jgi:uncharacterized protein